MGDKAAVLELALNRKNHMYEPVIWGTDREVANPKAAWKALKHVGSPTWFFRAAAKVVRSQPRANVCKA